MSFSDPEFAAKYQKYLETQSRVSDWVSQTSSSSYSSEPKKARRSSRTSEASSSTKTGKHLRKPKVEQAHYLSTTSAVNPLPAVVGLVSSSLFVMTFLPSILTLLSFAFLITCATVIDQREKDRKDKVQC